MRRFFLLLALLVPYSVAVADDPPPEAADRVESAPASVEAAMKQLAEETEKLNLRMMEIQATHDKMVDEVQAKTIGHLKAIARGLAGKGEIAEATKAWTGVLRLDGSDEDARKYFTAIGRLDVVQKQVAKGRKANFSSLQRTKFVTQHNGNVRVFEKKKGSVWIDSCPEWTLTMQEVYRDGSVVILRRDNGDEHCLLESGYMWGRARDRTGSAEHIWRDGEPGYWAR
ncbi:MAG: hypothetical protein ACF788_03935 [Novipirellula sp. JB048]